MQGERLLFFTHKDGDAHLTLSYGLHRALPATSSRLQTPIGQEGLFPHHKVSQAGQMSRVSSRLGHPPVSCGRWRNVCSGELGTPQNQRDSRTCLGPGGLDLYTQTGCSQLHKAKSWSLSARRLWLPVLALPDLAALQKLLPSAGLGDIQRAAPAYLLSRSPELEWEGSRMPPCLRSKNAGRDPSGPSSDSLMELELGPRRSVSSTGHLTKTFY